jgi:hypothetical protein
MMGGGGRGNGWDCSVVDEEWCGSLVWHRTAGKGGEGR